MAFTLPTFGSNPYGAPSAPKPAYTPPAFAASPGGSGSLQSLMDFFKTPGGAAAINFGGGLLKGLGDASAARSNQRQNANEFAASTALRQQEDQTAAAQSALNANPLGANQKYAQRQALLNAIMPNVRNFRATPGDSAVANAMGKMSGGIMDLIPEGGFDAQTLAAFAPTATAHAIAQHDMETAGVNPEAPMTDLAALGFAPEVANPLQGQVNTYLTQQNAQRQQVNDAIQRALANDIAGQKKGGHGFLKTLGKIGAIAAPIAAAPFTGGASLALIGAGAGAANAALNGGGIGSILAGAGLGAIPGLGTPSGLAEGAVAPSLETGLKQAFTNPSNYLRLALGGLS